MFAKLHGYTHTFMLTVSAVALAAFHGCVTTLNAIVFTPLIVAEHTVVAADRALLASARAIGSHTMAGTRAVCRDVSACFARVVGDFAGIGSIFRD